MNRAGGATPAAKWAKALELFRLGLVEAGYRPSTIDRVWKQVARFGRECGWAPYDLDQAAIIRWLDRLDCSPSRVYAYRTSLRTFYRWAHRTGRIDRDPTEHTSHLALTRPAPDSWHPAVQEWRRHMQAAKLSPETVRLRCYQVTRAAAELPAPGPWQVSGGDLADWLAGHRWSRGTTYSYRAALRAFYGWAVGAGHTLTNPAEQLPKIRMPVRMARPAPDPAYRQALAAAAGPERLMLRLAAEIGLRRAEIAHVHTEDVQRGVQDPGWWLEVHGKGDRVRYLPLPDDLARELRTQPAGWVFPGKIDGHLAPATVTRKISRLLPDQWTAHTLRHRFATNAYAIDHDLFAVQRMLGHARPDTTQIYVSVPESALRRLVTAAAAG